MQENIISGSVENESSRTAMTFWKFLRHPSFHVAVIFSFLVAGLILKIVFISGPQGSDDLNYFRFAEQIVRTFNLDTHHHHAGRLAFLVMSGFPAVLMGKPYYGALANVIYCLITEILVIGFLYYRLGLAPAAVGAAFLTLSGISLVYSGTLSPEPVLALFFICTCLALYQAINSTGGERWIWGALAGIAAGLAYSAKITGILILPPAILSLILLPWPVTNLRDRTLLACIFLVGFAGIWALDSTVYWVLSGDFLYKVHAIASIHNSNTPVHLGLLMFLKRGYWNLYNVLRDLDFFLVPVAIAGMAWLAMLYSRTPWALFALVGAFTGGYLFFGTSSLFWLANLPSQDRYTFLLFPLIAVGAGYLFWKWNNAVVRTIIVGLIVVNGAFSVHGATHRVGHLYFEPLLRNSAIAIELLPQIRQKQIYVEKRYRAGLRYYLPDNIWRKLREIPLKGPLPPGYYMVIQEHLTEPYKDKSENRPRYEEIARLPVALRVAFPHTFASRYFPQTDTPKYSAIVHEKL